MSSDSDLDFESADEDAEFTLKVDTLKKETDQSNDLKSEKSFGNTERNDSVCVPKSEDKANERETSTSKCFAGKTAKHSLSENKTEAIDNESFDNTECNEGACVLKNQQEADEKESTVSKFSTVNEANQSPSESEEKIESIDKNIESFDSVDNVTKLKGPELGSSNEKQRVILRLEKKKQEKKVSKETPLTKEKPEDLVNILEDTSKQQSSWGFGSWGSSLLSTAASSVSTFSTQVSQGIGTVLETVESTLGAPSPEELAHTLNEKEPDKSPDELKEKSAASMLPDISAWTKVFENTGNKVISGGLNTLEFIGKKTIDILTEGDPGLRNKRSAFSNAANLSELLKEIKARAEEQTSETDSPQGNIPYSQIFDEKQGVVHLEALEMLSKQSKTKFQRLLLRHSKDSEIKRRLQEIKVICEKIPSLDDPSECEGFEDFEAVFKKHSLEMNLPLNVDGITKVQRNIDSTISTYSNKIKESCASPNEVYQSGICSLAEFTAKCIETFHKVAELILVQTSADTDLEHCATNLTGLTTVMCIEVNNMSSKYHKCLEEFSETSNAQSDVTTWATDLYLEGANSINYIQDAYQMLVPVLQVRLLETIE